MYTKVRTTAGVVLLFLAMIIVALFYVQPADATGRTSASTATAAKAKAITGGFRHGADSGYDPTIRIRCNFGVNTPANTHHVKEGEHSDRYCNDTDQVYVRAGEEIWKVAYTTSYGNVYEKEFDATGWHKINDLYSEVLTVRKD